MRNNFSYMTMIGAITIFIMSNAGCAQVKFVKDDKKIEQVLCDIKLFATNMGLEVMGVTPSPILGAKGNREFLIYIKK